jgi:hypothetical protein
MAHAKKPDFVFRRNGRVNLNRRGRQFSLLAAEVCASAVVMLDTPRSEVVWRVLATNSIRQFPLHFPSLRHRVPSHFNWSMPLTAIFTRKARGLAHNNDYDSLTKTFWKSLECRTVTIYSFYHVLTVRRQIFRITIIFVRLCILKQRFTSRDVLYEIEPWVHMQSTP